MGRKIELYAALTALNLSLLRYVIQL
jgi:hypothetical protein